MTDRSPAARAAYAELILALVDARADPATVRFDHELATAVAAGAIDETLARTLRWWQRESVRGVRDHLADVLPPLLETLETAAARAEAAALSVSPAAHAVAAAAPPDTVDLVGADDDIDDTAVAPPVDLTDRRRRMVVAGLVSVEGAGGVRDVEDIAVADQTRREGHE